MIVDVFGNMITFDNVSTFEYSVATVFLNSTCFASDV